MLKKILPVAACLVLALGAIGCSAPAATDTAEKDSTSAEVQAPTESTTAVAEPANPAPAPVAQVPVPELSDELIPFEGSEFDQGCLSCHESYDAVAEKTAEYGDSNPHASIHGRYGSCQNCHEADKVVNEDQKCLSCHAWPREEQSMSR